MPLQALDGTAIIWQLPSIKHLNLQLYKAQGLMDKTSLVQEITKGIQQVVLDTAELYALSQRLVLAAEQLIEGCAFLSNSLSIDKLYMVYTPYISLVYTPNYVVLCYAQYYSLSIDKLYMVYTPYIYACIYKHSSLVYTKLRLYTQYKGL